jgi:hypothetical protein
LSKKFIKPAMLLASVLVDAKKIENTFRVVVEL